MSNMYFQVQLATKRKTGKLQFGIMYKDKYWVPVTNEFSEDDYKPTEENPVAEGETSKES